MIFYYVNMYYFVRLPNESILLHILYLKLILKIGIYSQKMLLKTKKIQLFREMSLKTHIHMFIFIFN